AGAAAPDTRGVLHGDHRHRPDDREGAEVIAQIANLGVWELFKLRRRWMMWILLVFALLFAQLAVWGGFFSYQNLRDTGGELTVPATLQQQQGRVPRTVRCNDLLSGDPSRQPASVALGSTRAGALAGAAADAAGTAATWSDALVALWKAWVSILPYIALVAFVTVLARSSAAGMAIGLGYYFAEQLIVALLTNFF